LVCRLQRRRMSSSPLVPSSPGQSTSVASHRHCRGRTSRHANRYSRRSTMSGCTGRLDPTRLGGCSSQRALHAAPLTLPPSWQSAPP
jgi:hypothetical protein